MKSREVESNSHDIHKLNSTMTFGIDVCSASSSSRNANISELIPLQSDQTDNVNLPLLSLPGRCRASCNVVTVWVAHFGWAVGTGCIHAGVDEGRAGSSSSLYIAGNGRLEYLERAAGLLSTWRGLRTS